MNFFDFWWILNIFDRAASWFSKTIFEMFTIAIHATTFDRFGPRFSRWFRPWGPPRFTFEILDAKKIRKRNPFARELQIARKVAVFDQNLSVTPWFDHGLRSFLESSTLLCTEMKRVGRKFWHRIVSVFCRNHTYRKGTLFRWNSWFRSSKIDT